MTVLPLGDLSTSFTQKLHTRRLKSEMQTLTNELASGQKNDLRKATGGNFTVLASLEHQMSALKSYKVSANEAGFFANSLQTALGSVQMSMDALAGVLVQAGDAEHGPWIDSAAADAKARFQSAVASLNVNVADQSLLGGTASGTAALADAETILADLTTALTGATTVPDVEAAINAWFDDPGGGFETSAYLGSDDSRAPFRVGLYETVAVDVTAADPRIRDVLKGYAMAALVGDGLMAGNERNQAALLRRAGEIMFSAIDGFSTLRGEIGAAEAAIDDSMARNSTELVALELARTDIIAADPYDTAVDLEATQLQLEALYAITARLSRLSLTEYLR